MIDVVEINADNQIVSQVIFDVDDIDAALEELDARYLAGEAAAHSHTWSLIARAYAGFNRRRNPRGDAGLGECRPSARGRNGTG